MTEVTRILSAIEQGDPSAAERLLPLIYDELRKLGSAKQAVSWNLRPAALRARSTSRSPRRTKKGTKKGDITDYHSSFVAAKDCRVMATIISRQYQ